MLLTADHVVNDSISLKVATSDLKITGVLHRDSTNDFVIFSVNKSSSKPFALRAPKLKDVGAPLYCISTHLGVLEKTISDGILSAIRGKEGSEVIQYTTTVNKGSSGGPLIMGDGKVVGLVTSTIRAANDLNLGTSSAVLLRALSNAVKTQSERPSAKYLNEQGFPNYESLGYVATVALTTSIYGAKSTTDALSKVNADAGLVITGVTDSWATVLMSNGSTGYVPAWKIRFGKVLYRTDSYYANELIDLAKDDKVSIADPRRNLALALAKVDRNLKSDLIPEMQGFAVTRLENLRPCDILIFKVSEEQREYGVFLGYFPDGSAKLLYLARSGSSAIRDLRDKELHPILVAARRIAIDKEMFDQRFRKK